MHKLDNGKKKKKKTLENVKLTAKHDELSALREKICICCSLGSFSVTFPFCFVSPAHRDGCSVPLTTVKTWIRLVSAFRRGRARANVKECRCQHLSPATNWQLWHGWGFFDCHQRPTATSLVLSSSSSSSLPTPPHPPRVLLHLFPSWEIIATRHFVNCARQCQHRTGYGTQSMFFFVWP